MDVTDFDAERPRLTAIAIRILGSGADADDVLKEAWLRLSRTDDVDDLPAWLTTVVTRLCLDHLRKRRTRSEAEVEAPADPAPVDPEADALLAERAGGAMQGCPRCACAGRAGGVRAARCLRLSLRRDQRDLGALGHRGTPVGEPGAPQGAGHTGAGRGAGRARREPPRRGCVPRCRPRRGAGDPAGSARARRGHGRRPGRTADGHGSDL